MPDIRRADVYLINRAGSARFAAQWGRDTAIIFPLLERTGHRSELRAANASSITGVTINARAQLGDPVILGTWFATQAGTIYNEWKWQILSSDFPILLWEFGETRKVVLIDIVVTFADQANSVDLIRSVEDAAGNFVFPLTIHQNMAGSASP